MARDTIQPLSVSLYVDSSAALRAVVDDDPEATSAIAGLIERAGHLFTSRLSLVETARALLRLRLEGASEGSVARWERDIEDLWAHCEILELDAKVCERARGTAPTSRLRTLDALHLASFLSLRSQIAGLRLLTYDRRLAHAAGELPGLDGVP